MGLTQLHALSRLLKFYPMLESVPGTFEPPGIGVQPAGHGNAAKVMKTDFSLEQERQNIEVSRQTRSLLERCTRRGTVTWSVESEIRPSGTAGTPPDLHPLLKAAMGSYLNSPGVSDGYTLANTQSLDTVSLYRVIEGVIGESIWGGWVNAMTINVSGTDKPTIKFDGGAMQMTVTGSSTADGDIVSSDQVTVQAADTNSFGLNSLLKLGSEENGGFGFQVITHTEGSPTFTVDTATSGTVSDGSDIVPFGPAETTQGSPLCGILGNLTYDSDSPIITAAEISMDNGLRPIDDDAFARYVSDIVPGFRSVTGSLTLRARKDWIYHFANRKTFQTRNLAIAVGTVAGSILTIDLPFIELDFGAVDVPAGDGDVVIPLPFTALASSGEDEMALTFS